MLMLPRPPALSLLFTFARSLSPRSDRSSPAPDFNVPQDKSTGEITNPAVSFVLDNACWFTGRHC